jgi:hypothetical protein
LAPAPAFVAPAFGVQSAAGRPIGGYDANVNMSNRIQMLQMQNRILMAKQQNMMFKQALARSYFSPAAQPQASFSDAAASPRSNYNANYGGGYSQQPAAGPSQQFPPQQAPYQPQYQPPSYQPPMQQPQPTYAAPQQPSGYSQPPGNAPRGDYYRDNGPFQEPFAPGNAQLPPQYAPQPAPALRQPSAAPAQPSPQAAPTPSSAGAPPVAAPSQGPSLTPSSSTASLQRQPSVASVASAASFRPDNEPTPVVPAAAAPARRQLRTLVSDLAQQVSSVQQTMQQDRQQHLSLAEQLREQKKLEKTRLLASLQQQKQQQQLSQQNNGADEAAEAALPILPRWRHLLLGHKLPLPAASLMKMKRLWRAVAFALVCVVVVPQRRALHRKQQRRDKAAKDCARSLRIFVEGCEEWLGKRVALPLQSIVDDASLDFDLRNLPSHLKKAALSGPQQQQLEKHLVPLKVRFKALVQALTSSIATGTATADGTAATAPALPSAKATAFLVGLIDDDNYFPDDFLFACEDAVVSKSSLGGTRGIVAPAETEDDAARFSKALETQLRAGGPSSLSEALLAAERRLVVPVQIEIARKRPSEAPAAGPHDAVTPPAAVLRRFVHTGAVRMLLLDTLLVRVLVTRIVLTPWHTQVSKPPQNRHTRRVTANLRTLASLCYALARRLNPALPTREDVLAKVQVQTAVASAAATADGSDVASAAAAASADAATAATATAAGASKAAAATAAGGKGMFGALLKLTGFADTTPGHEDFQAGSVEYALLAPRFSPYETLEETMKLLLPRGQVFPSTAVHDVLDGWLEELAPVVRQWLDAVTTHVLQAHLLKHHERLYLAPAAVDAPDDAAASAPAAPSSMAASSSRLAPVASVGGGIGGLSAAPSMASLRAASVAS